MASLAHPGLLATDDKIPGYAASGLSALEARHRDHDSVRRRTLSATSPTNWVWPSPAVRTFMDCMTAVMARRRALGRSRSEPRTSPRSSGVGRPACCLASRLRGRDPRTCDARPAHHRHPEAISEPAPVASPGADHRVRRARGRQWVRCGSGRGARQSRDWRQPAGPGGRARLGQRRPTSPTATSGSRRSIASASSAARGAARGRDARAEPGDAVDARRSIRYRRTWRLGSRRWRGSAGSRAQAKTGCCIGTGEAPPHIRARVHLARAVALAPALLHPRASERADLEADARQAFADCVAWVTDAGAFATLVITTDDRLCDAGAAHRALTLEPATGALKPHQDGDGSR